MTPTLKHSIMEYFVVLNPPDFGISYPTHPCCVRHHRYGEPLALRYASRPSQARDVLTPDITGMIPISTLFTLSGESAIADQSALARGTPLGSPESWNQKLGPEAKAPNSLTPRLQRRKQLSTGRFTSLFSSLSISINKHKVN